MNDPCTAIIYGCPNLAEFLQINKISNEDDEIVHARDGLEHVPTECPVKTDILNTLELLQKFS